MIPVFSTRMEQLNSHLPILPCLKDSNQAMDVTARMNISFSEHEITIIILCCMPNIYDDQFWLPMSFIPTALPQLRTKLEAIHRACECILSGIELRIISGIVVVVVVIEWSTGDGI